MRDWRATFLQVETTGFDLETSNVTHVAHKVWSLNEGVGPEMSGPTYPHEFLTGQIVICAKPEFSLGFLERECGPIKTKQRIDLCSLAAPLLVCGHVTSVSLDALAEYFGVPDKASKLDTMIEVWEGLLAAFLLKEQP